MTFSVFSDFVGKSVKAPYTDGKHSKIARGLLSAASQGFVKIKGELGTIIIRESNIQKMSTLDSN